MRLCLFPSCSITSTSCQLSTRLHPSQGMPPIEPWWTCIPWLVKSTCVVAPPVNRGRHDLQNTACSRPSHRNISAMCCLQVALPMAFANPIMSTIVHAIKTHNCCLLLWPDYALPAASAHLLRGEAIPMLQPPGDEEEANNSLFASLPIRMLGADNSLSRFNRFASNII